MSQRNSATATRHRVMMYLDAVSTLAMIIAACGLIWRSFGWRSADQDLSSIVASPVSVNGAPLLGRSTAKVLIVEFSDFQCPYCRQFANHVLPTLKSRYIETGLVQLAFRHVPLSRIHQAAIRSAEVAVCSARQGRFWQMHDLLFSVSGPLDDVNLDEDARRIGLDMSRYSECMNNASAAVQADLAIAGSLGIKGTPTLLIGTRVNETQMKVAYVVPGSPPLARLTSAVDRLLGGDD